VSASESNAAATSRLTNESEENLVNDARVNKSGDSSKAATWLQSQSLQEQQGNRVDPNLNAEQFTLEKERLIRSQKVTIERAKGNVAGTNRTMTTIDDYGIAQQFDEAEQAMAAEREAARQKEEGDDALHKPKVATWGVFPRPQNISEAYGGGRNIRPGQELESKEEAKKRGDRISKALADYRRNAGLEVDSAIEEKATKLYEEGEELFERGSISSALEKFSASADLVPLKCKIGGLANFRKAVCLDSLGRNEEAYPIYKSLKGHTAPGVSKNSQRMLFGFRAAKKLKVDTMDYSAGGVEAWRGYFDKATEGTWAAYRASQSDSEEDQATEKSATVVATAVMLLPLLLVSVLASQH
jgi:tetratricopeptide (TPR) repeat protein